MAQSTKEAIADLEDLLVSAVAVLFDGEPTHRIRANVMVKVGQSLRMFCSANMKVFPDYQMSLRIGQGCAGVAWQRAVSESISECGKPVYAPRAQLSPGDLRGRWKLTDEQIRLTDHIIWVLSIPIFSREQGTRKFLGVLNFDGVNADLKRPERIATNDFLGRCVAISERIAEELSSRCASLIEELDSKSRAK